MAIRTILAPLNGLPGGEIPLDAALLVGRRMGAHVEVLHVRIDGRDAAPFLGEGATAGMIEELMESTERDARRNAVHARAAFDARVAAGGVWNVQGRPSASEIGEGRTSVAWREVVGREDEVVARRGRLFDLVVVGRPGGDGNACPETTLEAALMESGRPILVAPPVAVPDIGTRIAIAWNGSTAAARAVAAAGAFLSRAEYVTILEGDGAAEDGASADELAAILGWHGVFATLRRFDSRATGIGTALLAAAAKERADLLVMGGYGHSRLREMLFGGATIDAMFESNLPLLMTH